MTEGEGGRETRVTKGEGEREREGAREREREGDESDGG